MVTEKETAAALIGEAGVSLTPESLTDAIRKNHYFLRKYTRRRPILQTK
jgi:hypothetical protein